MTSLRIGRGHVLVGDTLEARTLVVTGDMIESVEASADSPDIDAAGLIVSPGFVEHGRHGTLAGSALTMDQANRNLVEFTGCGVHEALLAATPTPTRLIRDASRGQIRPGALADLVLLDADLRVQITIRAGRVVYLADGARDRLAPHLRAQR